MSTSGTRPTNTMDTGSPEPHAVPPTILVIDDQIDNLEVMQEHLGVVGFTVLVAQDEESGLDQASYAQPDLILLDVTMPGMDGFEICRRLKAAPATSAIPVIFITALDDTADKVAGFAAGGLDYITKPFQAEEVLARVQSHLAMHTLQQRLAAQNVRLQREIAERQQAAAALRQAHAELAHQSADLRAANAELAQYAYAVSHDLQAPLRAIHNYADFLIEDLATALTGDQHRYLMGLGRAVREAEDRSRICWNCRASAITAPRSSRSPWASFCGR
jgi:two-component system, sensor histidine kinase and response regulator